MEFHGSSYTLSPDGCSSAACVETGTYTVDPAQTLLTLAATKGQSRELPLHVLETGTIAGDAKPQDLVQPSGVLGNPSDETTKAQQTVGPKVGLTAGVSSILGVTAFSAGSQVMSHASSNSDSTGTSTSHAGI
jgi:hypothetical protein